MSVVAKSAPSTFPLTLMVPAGPQKAECSTLSVLATSLPGFPILTLSISIEERKTVLVTEAGVDGFPATSESV